MIPLYEELETPIIMNIAGSTEAEYCEILEMTESASSNIAGYEINISCPNVKAGGMEFGVDCDLTEQLTSRLRKLTERLLIMKLSPNVTDIAAIGIAEIFRCLVLAVSLARTMCWNMYWLVQPLWRLAQRITGIRM